MYFIYLSRVLFEKIIGMRAPMDGHLFYVAESKSWHSIMIGDRVNLGDHVLLPSSSRLSHVEAENFTHITNSTKVKMQVYQLGTGS